MTRSVASLHSYPLNASRLHPSPDARIRTSGRDISPVSPDLQRIFNVPRFASTIAQKTRDGENRVSLNRRFVAVLHNTYLVCGNTIGLGFSLIVQATTHLIMRPQ